MNKHIQLIHKAKSIGFQLRCLYMQLTEVICYNKMLEKYKNGLPVVGV